jgi:hypothetical protein
MMMYQVQRIFNIEGDCLIRLTGKNRLKVAEYF